VNLEFLIPSASAGDGEAPVARSPMEGAARAAGARFELRDGWNIAVEFPGKRGETVGWTDTSHLPKLELQGDGGALAAAAGTRLSLGTAVRQDGAWWCLLTSSRALVIGARPALESAEGVDVVDVTSNFASLTLTGPQARETFARFCALDLRPHVTPVGAVRPGSIGRQPGILVREDEDRYLILFGWATGEYMWSVVADAGGHLGGGPLGLDSLGQVADSEPEAARA
jgi:heterotetrameric sarcosine oxidase gamma subunit